MTFFFGFIKTTITGGILFLLSVILLLVLICFVSGLLFRSKYVKNWIKKLEDQVLINLPGYALIKSITARVMGETLDEDMCPILIPGDGSYSLAFLVEKGEKFCTAFIPETPKHDSGEMKNHTYQSY